MPNLFLEKSIEISAPAARVWSLLVEPSWEAEETIEGKGKILKIEPEKIFKHNTLRLTEGLSVLTSVVTYELRPHASETTLLARESFAEAQSDQAFKAASEGWERVLQEIKKRAEA